MGHSGAADGFDQGFLNDTFFDVKGQFAGALLRGTPAYTVSKTGNISDFLGLGPGTFLRDRGGSVFRALGNADHLLDFFCEAHCGISNFILFIVKG